MINKYGIYLRPVEVEDAEFILSLRNNPKLNAYISSTSSSLQLQKNWIESYKLREEEKIEYYFICQDSLKERWGTTRIYNFDSDSFELGSWIFKENNNNRSIIADILTKEFAFEKLGFEFCTFNVMKQNRSVLRYHSKYQPDIISEDDLNVFFKLSKFNFLKHKEKFIKLLTL
jgi:RimJ/RimL family protein N-acetyltransferase